jgi:xanthine/CO dehydrogenase XdhC/CoxF family maturation factor
LEGSQVAAWEIVAQGQALRQARRPFALATVVCCERPASARPGDQALITEDGHTQGWIGGSCAEPVIVREALRALRTGRGCLVRLGLPPHSTSISTARRFHPCIMTSSTVAAHGA